MGCFPGSTRKACISYAYFVNVGHIRKMCGLKVRHRSYIFSSSDSWSEFVNDRRQKFVKLAEARVSKALKDIQLIGNLSNTSAYDFNEADVRKMFSALQKSLDAAKARYSRGGDGVGGEFKLGD